MRRVRLKTDGEIDALCEAGRLSAKALRLTGEQVRPGVSTIELDRFAEEVIRSEGGTPGFKGYGGFPGTICASINDQVVHGFPSPDRILHEGDIVSIDTGAVVDGWYGDNAWTFPVGEVSPVIELLLKTTERALYAGMRQAHAGKRLGDIGAAVQQVAEEQGFEVIREYCGHGVGRDMHEAPDVLNFGRAGRGRRLKPGMVLAIEPMVTAGSRLVHTLPDGWGVVTDDGSYAAHFEKTVAITSSGEMRVVSTENLWEEPAMHPEGERNLGIVKPLEYQ